MPAFIAADPTIPEIGDMSFIKEDPVGDNLEGDENLDITGQYFGYSDNRIYAAIDNNSGNFPTDSGGLFPDAYYFYIFSNIVFHSYRIFDSQLNLRQKS